MVHLKEPWLSEDDIDAVAEAVELQHIFSSGAQLTEIAKRMPGHTNYT